MDECLASLDSKVMRHVLQECILKLMVGRTRVFVSEARAAIAASNVLCVMYQLDSPSCFTVSSGPSSYIMTLPGNSAEMDTMLRATGEAGDDPLNENHLPAYETSKFNLSNALLVEELMVREDDFTGDPPQVSFVTLWEASVGGRGYAVGFMILIIFELGISLLSNWWLMQWSESSDVAARSTVTGGILGPSRTHDTSVYRNSIALFLGILGALYTVHIAIAIARQFVLVKGISEANDALHSAALSRVQHALLRSLNSVPRVRIIGWFDAHLFQLDTQTYEASEFFWRYALFLPVTLVAELIVVPWIILPAGIITLIVLIYFYGERRDYNSSEGPTLKTLNSGMRERAPSEVDGPRFRRSRIDTATNVSSSTTFIRGSSRRTKLWACLGRPRPRAHSIERDRVLARVSLDLHVETVLEGSVSLRAMGASATNQALVRYVALISEYNSASTPVNKSMWRKQFFGALLGGFFFFSSGVVILALRMNGGVVSSEIPHYGTGITASEAGYLFLHGCFASICTSLVLQYLVSLEALSRSWGSIVWGLTNLRQEASAYDTAFEAARSAEITAKYFLQPATTQQTLNGTDESRGICGSQSSLALMRDIPHKWPNLGHLVVSDLYASYGREGSSNALRGVSINVRPGSWVSIVGRTGAGKSSLLAAVVRIMELSGGSVTLDGIDISHVPLRTLRKLIPTIPQEPILIAGTLRANLDPRSEFSDEAILESLKRVGFVSDTNSGMPAVQEGFDDEVRSTSLPDTRESDALIGKTGEDAELRVYIGNGDRYLDAHVAELGANLTLIQRQRIAFARALLGAPRLILIDEVNITRANDTEVASHRAMRVALRGVCSVLHVSHQLITAVDSDWVVVLDDGEVTEQGPPSELLQRMERVPIESCSAGRGKLTLFDLVNALPNQAREHVLRVAMTTRDFETH